MAQSPPAPDDGFPARVTVDVVDLRRIERVRRDFGPRLERRLLGPAQLNAIEPADLDRRLAAELAVKEAWIESRGGRPAGWTFRQAWLAPSACPPDPVRAVIGRFVEDLDATSVQACAVHGDADDLGRWAWHGLCDHWLIAAVAT